MLKKDKALLKRLAVNLVEIQSRLCEVHDRCDSRVSRLCLERAETSVLAAKEELLGILAAEVDNS